jgi:hypothetical protein
MGLLGLINLVTAIITIASIISATVLPPENDERLQKVYKIITLLALNFGKAKRCQCKKT